VCLCSCMHRHTLGVLGISAVRVSAAVQVGPATGWRRATRKMSESDVGRTKAATEAAELCLSCRRPAGRRAPQIFARRKRGSPPRKDIAQEQGGPLATPRVGWLCTLSSNGCSRSPRISGSSGTGGGGLEEGALAPVPVPPSMLAGRDALVGARGAGFAPGGAFRVLCSWPPRISVAGPQRSRGAWTYSRPGTIGSSRKAWRSA
jgi:hypothetical protein